MWLRNREGTEPVTARSPLRMRRIMSLIALVVATAAAVFFVIKAMDTEQAVWRWEAAIAALVAIIAAIDLLVLRHKRAGKTQRGQHR